MPRPNVNTALIKQISEDQIKLASEWFIMKNEWQDVKKQEHKRDHKIDRILSLLENDTSTNSKGMVEQLRENTVFIKDMKSKVGILSLVGGIIASIGMWFIKNKIFKQ